MIIQKNDNLNGGSEIDFHYLFIIPIIGFLSFNLIILLVLCLNIINLVLFIIITFPRGDMKSQSLIDSVTPHYFGVCSLRSEVIDARI